MNHINYIDSLSAFTVAVENITETNKTMLFRGQPNIRCKLLPQAARGHTKTVETEAKMLAHIAEYGRDYIDVDNPSTCHLLMKAHNAGLETRLLDWTINPYEALWYACHSSGSQPLVYVLNTESIPQLGMDDDPFAITQTHIMPVYGKAADKNKRLTVHASTLIQGRPQFTALEEEEGMHAALTELPIMPDLKVKIIQELNEFGVNEHSIYNNLFGLCRHVNLMYDNNPYGWMPMDSRATHDEVKSDTGESLQQFKQKYVSDFDFD
ncbi:FRG domain-containing protein [Grimontia sp. NTOU-MAR1]|uniref:FRG domain-containing protein n=1 Tax=Grimontia sp. NTOU-MAR1 TaxID=3111011 RepID=UPI002DB9A366|nr:FRG domain-containing protein [Grimontia sp. NTOU-MAR1]WRV99730.1 FRG domain-containing protein [Grimontia sp. NTOU-MAR1]